MPTGVYPRTAEQYETRRGRSSKQKGVKRTPEQLKRISVAHLGQIPWNKGIKGAVKPPRNAFKPGFVPWNKGRSWSSETKERIAKTLENKREKLTPHSVYYLVDPRTHAPRYVGFSEHPERRFDGHVKFLRGSTHKATWIRSLLDVGLLPILSIKCIVYSKLEACRIETALIASLKSRGFDLTNATPGGEGGATMTGRKGPAHGAYGKKWSPESRIRHMAAFDRLRAKNNARQTF
jgi:hypothetical protein